MVWINGKFWLQRPDLFDEGMGEGIVQCPLYIFRAFTKFETSLVKDPERK